MKELYAIALPPIVRHVKQKRGTTSDGEDCFQEAVLALVKKVKEGTWDGKYEVKNFLFIVARNNWYNKLKRAGRLQTSDIDDVQVEDESEGVEAVMIAEERETAIATLMDKAGERCKELLRLVIFENKKLKELVELMGFSSEEVVKTNHYRCKQKLKEALKNDSHLLAALKG